MSALVDDLYALAIQHRDVCVFSKTVEPAMLDDEQTGFDVFDHETETRNRARRAPHAEFVIKLPDAEMNFGTLDGGREFHEHARSQRQRAFEDQRLAGVCGRKIRERDLGKASFLGTETGPER